MDTIKKTIKTIPGVTYLMKKLQSLRCIRWSWIARNPELYPRAIAKWYKKATGKPLDLNNPETFNEKIQWSKLHDRDPLRTKLADKYAVREFVAERIGEEYLIPLLGAWKDAEDIDFNSLPERFVLKGNHGSGCNIIVKDKSKLNISKARKKLNAWMKINYGHRHGLELHYADIPPLIIAEAYMEDHSIEGGQIRDYKFLCFNGEPHFVWVDVDRYTDHRRNIYDLDWTLQPWIIAYKNSKHSIQKPDNLDKMSTLVRALCHGIPQVRVDLYNINGKIYFGEMTFTSGNGIEPFTPPEYGKVIGDLWRL